MAKKKVSKKVAAKKKATAKKIEAAIKTEQTILQKMRAFKDKQAEAFNKRFG